MRYLYSHDGVIYLDTRIESDGNQIIPGTVIDKNFEISELNNVNSTPQDLCVIVELEGKLGVMVRSNETGAGVSPIFRCARSDFKYESIKVFVTKNGLAGPVCIIGSTEGKYHCFEISAQPLPEFGIDVKTLVYGDRYEECIKAFISNDDSRYQIKDLDLILGVASSSIRTLAPGQVFVFGADRAGRHEGGASEQARLHFGAQVGVGDGLMGNSYAITTMGGPLGNLKAEIDKFLTYAKEHPEKEFLVTRVACGNAGWADSDVAPLFHGILTLDNVPIPMKWVRYITSKDMFSLTMNVLLSSCGRATLDEWIGRLVILYAAHTDVPLNISGNGICAAEGAAANPVCDALIKMANAQNLSEEALNELSELRSTIRSVSHEKFESWYSRSFLAEILQRECVELAEGTLLNPGRYLKQIVNKFLADSECSRIYNPFAGICSLCDHADIKYVCQEPSPILSMIAQICSGDCSTGDFMSNWIGDGCDGLACILPFEYNTDHDVTDSKKVRGQRITKQLLHRLTQPESMKAAVVVVKKDVLISDDYYAFRRVFINQAHLARVIPLNSSCLTNNSKDYVLMYFDFTKKYESIRLACPHYFDMLECFGPQSNKVWTEVVDNISRYEKLVPRDYIERNRYCLDYYIYSVPISDNKSEVDVDCERQCYNEGDYDYIQLSDLLKEAEPIDGELNLAEIPRVEASDFSLYRRIIAQGLAHNYKTTVSSNEKAYNGKCLVVSRQGLFFSNRDKPFRTVCSNKVYKIDERKIDPNYLIGMLTDIPLFEKVYPYFENWRIPVINGGLVAQRNFAQERFPELLETARNRNRYNVILFGNIQPGILSGSSLEVIDSLDSYSSKGVDDIMAKYGRAVDAIIVDSSFGLRDGHYYGLNSVMSFSKPVYVIHSDDNGIVLGDEKRDKYLNGRVFTKAVPEMIDKIRSELDRENSPEAMIRNEYATEFKAAAFVQQAFRHDMNIAEEMQSILIETRKQDSRLAERSFDFFRNVRDLILGKLVDKAVLPDLDKGALSRLLAEKVYMDNKSNEIYYITGFLMPNNLSAGLQYLTFVSNEAVHNGNGKKDTALSAVHILFQLLIWTQEKIENHFFDSPHSGEYYKTDLINMTTDPKKGHVVSRIEKAGKSYFYTGNIHICGNTENLIEGETIYFYGRLKPEDNPYITEDLQIYLRSNAWRKG